jgi:hypothetical protein
VFSNSYMRCRLSTFSCDIAYSDSPMTSRVPR